MKKALLFILIIFMSPACVRQEMKQNDDVTYRYYGQFVSLVDQRNDKRMKFEYTLQIENFNPIESVFDKYNSQFSKGDDKYKHIEITKNTKIYVLENNIRREASIEDLRKSNDLEVWIKPYKLSEYMIEAVEVYIMK